MKQVHAELGGRPFANDDLLVIQKELTDAVQAQFLGKGAFILSGCQVSGQAVAATVTAGIVCLNGQLMRFAGASGVALPAQLQAGAYDWSDLRPYQTGGSKYCAKEVPAVLVPADPAYTGGEFLPLDTWGGKTWEHVQRASVRVPHEIGWVAAATLNNYDTNGVGLPGTEAWGWALYAPLSGRVAVGLDPSRPDYDTIGKQGGSESVSLTAEQNGPHTHNFPDATNSVTFEGGNSGARADNWNDKQPKNVSSSGSGAPHENRMPFAALLARQWVGF